MHPVRIFACETQPIVIEGLVRVFERCDDLALVGSGYDIEKSVTEALAVEADLMLLGQPPTAKSALPLLVPLQQSPRAVHPVLWVSEVTEMDSFRALQMGARGVISRTQTADVLLECLRTVSSGSVWLDAVNQCQDPPVLRRTSISKITSRERQVIELVCRGARNKDIAHQLSITPGTVKVHLMHIFEKTGVKDRLELALQGRQILRMNEQAKADSPNENRSASRS